MSLGNEWRCSRRKCLTDGPQLVIDDILFYILQAAHSAANRTDELDSVTGRMRRSWDLHSASLRPSWLYL